MVFPGRMLYKIYDKLLLIDSNILKVHYKFFLLNLKLKSAGKRAKELTALQIVSR